MKTYTLSSILKRGNVLTSIYRARREKYGYPIIEAMDSFKVLDTRLYGLNIYQLEILTEGIMQALRVKNKHKSGRIARDKSQLMQAYLILFKFIKKERQNANH